MTFGKLMLVCLAVLPAWSGAAEITLEIDAQLGENPIDLGFPVGQVLSLSMTGSVEITMHEVSCTALEPSFLCRDYSFGAFPEAWFDIYSNDRWAGMVVTDSGPFDSPLSFSASSADQLFADGTGVLTVSSFIEPGLEGCGTEGSCTYQQTGGVVGGVSLVGTVFLTIVFDESVPVSAISWSTIKAIYR